MELKDEDFSKLFKLSEKVSKVCKLFAEENLQIQFDSTAETACFYLQSRVLKFPYNMEMLSDDDIMILFMTHEVGHAKWSTLEYLKKANSRDAGNESNIVEDIRIERMIKHEYPGLAASYVRGYKKLYDNGFFGSVKSHPAMSFSNRLNIYAKCGPITAKNISFSKEEAEFYHRCMSAVTEQEVLDLSIELSKWKNSAMDVLISFSRGKIDEMFGEEVREFIEEKKEELDSEIDDISILESAQCQTAGTMDDLEEGANSLTEEEYAQFLEKIAHAQDKLDIAFEMGKKIDAANVTGATFINYESMPRHKNSHFTCDDYNEILKIHVRNMTYKESDASDIKKTQEFLSSLGRSVAYMAKEFEMKKAAARYKNSKISTSGSIDINRICQYKVTNEVFAKRIEIKDDKNHGMIILLDASGSISTMFEGMVKQVALLTEYAKKIGVPFKVFVFGGTLDLTRDIFEPSDAPPRWKSPMRRQEFALEKRHNFFEALSSDQTSADYLRCIDGLINKKAFRLYDTPTCCAMHLLENIANDFFDRNNTTNKKLFILTDGGPTDVQTMTNKVAIVDKMTHKLYRTNEACPYTPISVMGKIFGDRYGIDVSSFVVSNNVRNLGNFLSTSSNEYSRLIGDKSKSEFNKHKFVKGHDSFGLPLFVIKPIASETEVELEGLSTDSSVAKATSAFVKSMRKLQVSQTMLAALGEQFAI